jgi:hypothetical protein
LSCVSLVQATSTDWGVEGRDGIAWDAYYFQNNTFGISEWNWSVSVHIDGFVRSEGKLYINGSLYQNETIEHNVRLNQVTLGDLGPTDGFFIGDVLKQENINPKLISDSLSIVSLRVGINDFINDHPYYMLTEPILGEIFNITGSGTDGNYIWDYLGIRN